GIPTLTFSGGGGTGATAQVLAGVTGITLAGGGDGYTSAPTVIISGGGGSDTTATASVSSLGVGGVTLTQGGTGYSSLPTIIFSGGGARAANMTLSAPVIAVDAGATQSLTTAGKVIMSQGAGTAPAKVATNIGGALTVTAGSIMDTAMI